MAALSKPMKDRPAVSPAPAQFGGYMLASGVIVR